MVVLFLLNSNQVRSSLATENHHLNKHRNEHDRQVGSKSKAQKQTTANPKVKDNDQQSNVWGRDTCEFEISGGGIAAAGDENGCSRKQNPEDRVGFGKEQATSESTAWVA